MSDMTKKIEQIADLLLTYLSDSTDSEQISAMKFHDYHGFEKVTLPNEVVAPIAKAIGLDPLEVQAEIVRVRRDLTHELHHHEVSRALAICLGRAQHAEDPRAAQAFINGSWQPVRAGDKLEIPPGTVHGFTVAPGGELTFLSVQIPPLTGVGNRDDYIRRAS